MTHRRPTYLSKERNRHTTGTLYLPDGSWYVLESGGAKFIDRHGNALRYAAATRTWTDALGRTVGMPWPTAPQSADYTYSPPGAGAPYVFRWRHLADALTPDTQGATPALKAISDHYLPQPGQPPTPPGGSNFPQPAAGESLFFSASDESVDNGNFTYVVESSQTPGQLFKPGRAHRRRPTQRPQLQVLLQHLRRDG